MNAMLLICSLTGVAIDLVIRNRCIGRAAGPDPLESATLAWHVDNLDLQELTHAIGVWAQRIPYHDRRSLLLNSARRPLSRHQNYYSYWSSGRNTELAGEHRIRPCFREGSASGFPGPVTTNTTVLLGLTEHSLMHVKRPRIAFATYTQSSMIPCLPWKSSMNWSSSAVRRANPHNGSDDRSTNCSRICRASQVGDGRHPHRDTSLHAAPRNRVHAGGHLRQPTGQRVSLRSRPGTRSGRTVHRSRRPAPRSRGAPMARCPPLELSERCHIADVIPQLLPGRSYVDK